MYFIYIYFFFASVWEGVFFSLWSRGEIILTGACFLLELYQNVYWYIELSQWIAYLLFCINIHFWAAGIIFASLHCLNGRCGLWMANVSQWNSMWFWRGHVEEGFLPSESNKLPRFTSKIEKPSPSVCAVGFKHHGSYNVVAIVLDIALSNPTIFRLPWRPEPQSCFAGERECPFSLISSCNSDFIPREPWKCFNKEIELMTTEKNERREENWSEIEQSDKLTCFSLWTSVKMTIPQ